MAIYDTNGASTKINSLYDHNGSSNTQIKYVYDNDNTTNRLIYSSSKTLIPGTTFSKRGNYLSETSAGPSSISIICRDNPYGSYYTAAVFTYVDVSPYKTLRMNITCHFAAYYGQGLVGIGNFDTFSTTYWPNVTNGWGWGSGIQAGKYGCSLGGQTTAIQFSVDISSLSGSKCVGLCCVATSSVQATTHISCSKIWLE